MYQYEMDPIDYFEGCVPLADYLKNTANPDINDIISELVVNMGKFKGWEGIIQDGIWVFAIPDDVETKVGFVWKQDNNGTTFVISPIPLPHLRENE